MVKRRLLLIGSLGLFLLLPMAPTALAGGVSYVDGAHGSDKNDCKSPQTACKTIAHAISLASPGDSVMVAAAVYRENLSIDASLTIIGSSAKKTIIDGGGALRVVSILDSSAIVVFSNVTIRHGVASGGGGILNWGTLTLNDSIVSGNAAASSYSAAGGGIYSSGTLTINDSTLSNNGGTTNFVYGGAIYNSGALTIDDSTLSGNSASGSTGGGGGGIYNDYAGGTVVIDDSTISGNSASGYGGGGIDNPYGTVTIDNSTLSGNSASGYGGGAISSGGATTIQNSIVANSPSGGNCYGTVTSDGYNLSDDATCTFDGAGDLNGVGAKLGPLQKNGGPTRTQALLSGSPAIDAGNGSGCTDGQGHLLATDQRGMPRPDAEDTGGCDMGAYERPQD